MALVLVGAKDHISLRIGPEEDVDTWLKTLVAATCVAVLAATGWWGWTEWAAAQEQAAVMEREARLSRLEANERVQQHLVECRARVAAWDEGLRAPLIREFGTSADQIVENCRYSIAIPPESFAEQE
ncbi:hypothetical protein [Rubellimicrobium arenae]|uniref:hypothetical protein n=1 Tax=Rubellimicrobium arenae TaxID=2817372 RepID=UPI001B30CDC5|nr:hypothetical protein [Rubellimicrobium arenae]